jgi:hypothetical protein
VVQKWCGSLSLFYHHLPTAAACPALCSWLHVRTHSSFHSWPKSNIWAYLVILVYLTWHQGQRPMHMKTICVKHIWLTYGYHMHWSLPVWVIYRQ